MSGTSSMLASPGAPLVEIGGKALRLERAAALGVATPPGRVLSGLAHAAFLEANRMGDYQERLLAALSGIGLGELPAFVEELEERRSSLALPEPVREALEAACQELRPGGGPLILRSSANMEDLPDASLAGVFLSVGGVTTREEAEAALLEIWYQALTPGVATTLLGHDLDPRELRVPVLIQPHLPLERFAISFSLNPRDNSRSPLVEVSNDAEALTSGAMAPERLLGPARRAAVVDLDRELQEAFGSRLDLEIGWVDDALVLLQVRPQVVRPLMRTDARWSRTLTEERYPLPLTPLGFTNIEKVFVQAIRNFLEFLGEEVDEETPVACQMEGLVWANQNLFDFQRSLKLRLDWRSTLGFLGQAAARLWQRGRPLADLRDLATRDRSRGGNLGASPDSVVAEISLDYVLAFLDESEQAWIGDWDATLAAFLDRVHELERAVSPELSLRGFENLETALREATIEFLGPDLVIYALKEICFRVLGELLTLVGEELSRSELVAALGVMSENPTTRLAARLRSLARRRDEESFEEELEIFLEEFGHLTPSWELRDPLLAEDREGLLGLMDELGALPEAEGGGSSSPGTAAALRERVAAHPRLLPAYDALCERLERYMRMDEEHHLYTSRVLRPTRAIVRILGERLVEFGVLEDWDDIHFLRDHEVWRALLQDRHRSRGFLVTQRRKAYFRQRAFHEQEDRHIPILSWNGTGASRGQARGPARRIASLRDVASFRPGEVLVVRTPDPCWTLLYPLAAGLVAETGGLLSHGVVSAREHGLPVVLGLPEFFRSVRDGAEISLDGESGEVRLQETDQEGDAP